MRPTSARPGLGSSAAGCQEHGHCPWCLSDAVEATRPTDWQTVTLHKCRAVPGPGRAGEG